VGNKAWTAVVSGAASGMGLAVSARFVAEGWTVLAIDLNPEALSVARKSLGERLVPLAVDVCDREAVERALGTAADGTELRTVVNAAGICPTSTLADYTAETYRRIFDVNVLGTLNVTASPVPAARRTPRAGPPRSARAHG
jgi:3-oxoacyl-[acyl-carrier protein] reductase